VCVCVCVCTYIPLSSKARTGAKVLSSAARTGVEARGLPRSTPGGTCSCVTEGSSSCASSDACMEEEDACVCMEEDTRHT
jgi:hypothetical protein